MDNKLSFKEIRAVVPDELLDFETTREIETLEQIIGQERAVNALKFGINVNKTGFNTYIAGPPGTEENSCHKFY